jgi:uncharacterized protein
VGTKTKSGVAVQLPPQQSETSSITPLSIMESVMRNAMMAGLLFLAGPAAAWGQYYSDIDKSKDNRSKISVTGESVVYVQPDKILISLGIETSDTVLDTAREKNTEILKKTIAVLEKCGVSKKAIQTDNLSIYPNYNDHADHSSIAYNGYIVRNALVVTLTDVSKLEKMIAGVVDVGVVRVHNVDFQTTELRKYRDQARRLALKAARDKAKDMAEVLDQTIGKPLQISEINNYSWNYRYWSYCWCGSYWSWWSNGRDYSQSQNVAFNSSNNQAGGDELDTIALGKIGIRANVQVTFELKDE